MRTNTIIAAIGDIILERQPDSAAVSDVRVLVSGADIAVCSFEGVLSERGDPLPKSVTVRSHRAIAADLRTIGIDVAALANNHAMDFGADALLDTVVALNDAGIAAPGAGENLAAASSASLLTRADLHVAVLSVSCAFPPGSEATDHRPGVAALRVNCAVAIDAALAAEQPGMVPRVVTWIDNDDVERLLASVTDARRVADVVLVVIHWGVHGPWRAAAYGPLQDYQQPLGRSLIDAGADAVLGNHAVELQAIEIYRGRPIAYCLGVFWYDGIGDHPWVGREAIILGLRVRPNRAPDIHIVPVRMDRKGVPQLDNGGQTIEILRAQSAAFGTSIVAEDGQWFARSVEEAR
ncbi:MAG TPA: CapA family protein [Thermomicrobiales bacterium]|nr:CapA family protein [Thermomicrobiales bacterium]